MDRGYRSLFQFDSGNELVTKILKHSLMNDSDLRHIKTRVQSKRVLTNKLQIQHTMTKD